jgi:hypothetical protein
MAPLALLTTITCHSAQTTGLTGLIAMTVPEARRLINALNPRQPSITHTLHRSLWRRRHQAQATTSHHKHRARRGPAQRRTVTAASAANRTALGLPSLSHLAKQV